MTVPPPWTRRWTSCATASAPKQSRGRSYWTATSTPASPSSPTNDVYLDGALRRQGRHQRQHPPINAPCSSIDPALSPPPARLRPLRQMPHGAKAIRDAVLAAVAHQQHAHVAERLAALGAGVDRVGEAA